MAPRSAPLARAGVERPGKHTSTEATELTPLGRGQLDGIPSKPNHERCSVTVPFKTVKVTRHKKRWRNCSRLKETEDFCRCTGPTGMTGTRGRPGGTVL